MLANLPLAALNAGGIVRTLIQHEQAVFRTPDQPLLPIPVNDVQAARFASPSFDIVTHAEMKYLFLMPPS
ncbi:hypothetical protein [Ralstonia solanacearum]|uniref:hypothetical protein n=1 Tax=Ralstonia solanacearum TaxID=305 RepID=UPI002029C6C5|nr:hypothetical protein [Ralstonia solanacearum]MCL9846911.1 hypothetical protein [Ralstonia solanacearum]MDC6255656.1 hypothetical protein [Ralstonia solanacearum]MDC6260095.1 hypothetical protein [Ralstonia solanacearum]MDC6304975.1 hypothetical protein [Ralstonia solanacearum]